MMPFKLAIIQSKIASSLEDNLRLSANKVARAAENGADIVLLSELHTSPYFCQVKDKKYFKLAEQIPGRTSNFFAELAKKYSIHIVASIFEVTSDNRYYNTAILLDDNGEIIHTYRKVHIPSCEEYNETYCFKNGSELEPVKTKLGNIGILVCYDQWFPEAARTLAKKGAQIILIPTAIGYCPSDSENEQQRQLDAWKTIQRSHAIANNIYVAVCNRTGYEINPLNRNTGIDFWGNSFLAGPFGELISSGEQEEGTLIDEIDFQENEGIKKVWPFLNECQPNTY